MPEIEVAAAPNLSTIVFRHRPSHVTGDDLGPLNEQVRAELYRRGNGMVAATKVDGSTWLKLTLLNPRATVADIRAVLDDICAIGDDLGRDLSGSAEVA